MAFISGVEIVPHVASLGSPFGRSTSSATFLPMRSYFCARRIDLTSVLLIVTSDDLMSTLATSLKKRSASVALNSASFVRRSSGRSSSRPDRDTWPAVRPVSSSSSMPGSPAGRSARRVAARRTLAPVTRQTGPVTTSASRSAGPGFGLSAWLAAVHRSNTASGRPRGNAVR
jgi:hypothetical protein